MKLLLLSVAILSTCFIKHVQTEALDFAEKAAIKVMEHPSLVKKYENLLTSAGVNVAKLARNTDENMEQMNLDLKPEERDLAKKINMAAKATVKLLEHPSLVKKFENILKQAGVNDVWVKQNQKSGKQKRSLLGSIAIAVASHFLNKWFN